MELPDYVAEIVDKMTLDNLDDIDEAARLAEEEIRAMPDFKRVIAPALVTLAITELVYRSRCANNVKLKRENGPEPVVPNKVGISDSVAHIYKSVYDLCIGRKTLGNMTGAELTEVAHSERAIAAGHSFNAALCERLRPLVGDDQCVRDAVSEKKLKAIWNQIQGKERATASERNGHM